MTYSVTLENNLSLKMILGTERGPDKTEIFFHYEDINKFIYEGKEKIKIILNELGDKNFLKNKDFYKYKIYEYKAKKGENKNENENEIILTISKNGEEKASIALKCNQNEKDNKDDTKEAAPINNENVEKTTNTPSASEEITKKLNDLIFKYDEEIKNIKKENKKLVEENEKLLQEIDEEKRKNDEIVKIFLENREKYELAVKRNSDIQLMQSKL